MKKNKPRLSDKDMRVLIHWAKGGVIKYRYGSYSKSIIPLLKRLNRYYKTITIKDLEFGKYI